MADRVSTWITIGGTLSASQRPELTELIDAEGLSTEWDGPAFDAAQLRDGAPLALYAYEVAWGRFSDLEDWLIEHRLPFVRQCDGCCGAFGGERVIYRGGDADDTESYGTDEGPNIVVDRRTVERLGSMAALRAHFDAADFTPGPIVFALEAAVEEVLR